MADPIQTAPTDALIERLREHVAEVVAEGGGFWRPCSGCQESCDGCVSIVDYPYSPVFQCQPGGGCSECGGIGVIWDTIDYDAMARDMIADDRAAAQWQAGQEGEG